MNKIHQKRLLALFASCFFKKLKKSFVEHLKSFWEIVKDSHKLQNAFWGFFSCLLTLFRYHLNVEEEKFPTFPARIRNQEASFDFKHEMFLCQVMKAFFHEVVCALN